MKNPPKNPTKKLQQPKKINKFERNIARIANSCPESGWLSRCWGDKKFRFWVCSQFENLSFVTIWRFFSQFDFFSFVTIWGFEFCQDLIFFQFCHNSSFCGLSQFEFLSFVTIWFLEFCHILSCWVLTHFEFLSFVTIWVFEYRHNLSFLNFFFFSFVLIWVF